MPLARYSNSEDISAFALYVTDGVYAEEPRDYHGAMKNKESRKWDEACGEEITSLDKNQTWKLVRMPNKRKVIGCKWVFKMKSRIPGVKKLDSRLG